jgi:hypothetical protein
MSKVTFGGEGTLRIYKRFNIDETLKLTFKDANGSPYTFPSNLFTFNVRKNIKNSSVLFNLNSSTGLTLVSNELSITISAANSNLTIGEYYYQLLYDGDVYLNGAFVIYDRSVEAIN